jgi:arylsulfatase A-like enzyme
VGVAIPESEFTIADDLGNNHSYESAMFGKWNLGGTNEGVQQDYPRTRGGFDHFAGSYPVSSFRAPHYGTPKTTNGGATVNNAADRYITTDEAEDAITWISTATEPWFVALCFHAPHFSGVNAYLYPPTALQRNFPGTPNTDGGVNAYCSMLEALDTELGRVLDACDLNQTIVAVFADNGSAFVNPPVPAGRIKATDYDNGVRAPLIIRAPGTVNPGRVSNLFCHAVDIYPSLVKLATGDAASSPNALGGQDISGVMRGELVPRKIHWDSDNAGSTNPRITSDGEYRLYDFTTAPDEFYHLTSDPYEQTNLGTSGLTGPALKAYNNLRYALTTFTNKTEEQPVVVANYSQPSPVTGGIAVVRGGTAIIRPALSSATITAPLKSGATDYTLWVRDNPFGSWVDSGLTEAVGATVVFTDPSPVGRKEYRITNDAPEP